MYKQCILILLVGLVASGLSSNTGRWSKRETDSSDVPSLAYASARSSSSNVEDQNTSSPLQASEIETDNGLLQKLLKKKAELEKELQRLTIMCMRLANKDLSSSSANEQSQDYTESASPMLNANENVSDNAEENIELKIKLDEHKDQLTKAFDKYLENLNNCKREVELSKKDILLHKGQIDIYYKQINRAQKPQEQIL